MENRNKFIILKTVEDHLLILKRKGEIVAYCVALPRGARRQPRTVQSPPSMTGWDSTLP